MEMAMYVLRNKEEKCRVRAEEEVAKRELVKVEQEKGGACVATGLAFLRFGRE